MHFSMDCELSWWKHSVALFFFRKDCWKLFETSTLVKRYWQLQTVCFKARVSQVNVNYGRSFFSSSLNCRWPDVWSLMYSSVVIIFPAVSFGVTENQSNLVPIKMTLNHVCACHQGVFADNVLSKSSLVRSFLSQYSKLFVNLSAKIASKIPHKNCTNRFFICRVIFIILCSFRFFDSDIELDVIVSLSN